MAVIVAGVAETPYARHPPQTTTPGSLLGEAASLALEDSGLSTRDIDGLAVSSFSLAPDHAIDLAWRLGLSLKWLMDDPNGGASGLNMLAHAVRAIEGGDASAVLILAGDSFAADEFSTLVDNFNSATRDHLAPLGYGGPNSLFAMLTLRQMQVHELAREDYGRLVLAQRRWAGLNPQAAYRSPLSMEEYLTAPLVAGPLGIYDCPPVVAGANALVVLADPTSPRRDRPQVQVRGLVTTFNIDHQASDGLRTGLSEVAPSLWDQAACGPDDVDLVAVYDDYPAMVLAQLADLGLAPDGNLKRFLETELPGGLPINTSGGQLSAGQAGAGGALHGLVEAVRQLQGRTGPRQVADARTALVTGYGMALYRYGAAAAAAVLQAAQR